MTQTFRFMLQQNKGVQADLTDDEDDDSKVYNHWGFNKDKKDKSTQAFEYGTKETNPSEREDNEDEDGDSLTPTQMALDVLGMGVGLGISSAYYGGKLAYHGLRTGIS